MPDCAPKSKPCGQPTVSILDGLHFGVVSGNLASNSCLSYAGKHRFSVSDFENVDPTTFSLNKNTGDFSLKPIDPTKPWSFKFWVKSYDCTEACRGKTQFDPDGPATVSGDPIIDEYDVSKYVTENISAILRDTLPRFDYQCGVDPKDVLEIGDLYFWRDHDNGPYILKMWDGPFQP